ncbi:MAG: D-alanyl-D-alanine carboxypeptidase [Burkholderiales bacterium]|nr:D-alanyl-D-alanine carboxypeptidase [Burkholderiales bacterium]
MLAGLLFLSAAHARAAEDAFPTVAAAYAVETDGVLLWAGNVHRPLPPASLTKIMTALLVLERGELDAVVRVSAAAAAETGARIGLHTGDTMRVRDLLTAALLRSANDACHALADWHAGDQARFVARMNLRAQALGLTATHFANACGHDAPRHQASARDLVVLARTALRLPEFARLVGLREARIATADRARSFELRNTNALLGRLPGAAGVKSGFTSRAGKCILALARRDGHEVLLVLLNAPDRWWDAHGLAEAAFAHLSRR